MNFADRPIRVLVAKPGLDGHDRGAQIVALALRDAGMEVVYTGLRASISAIIEVAIQEDVDVIGLSILSGAHLELTRKLIAAIDDRGGPACAVVVGGTIPPVDVPKLKEIGADAVFPMGTDLQMIVTSVRKLIKERRQNRTVP